MKKLSILFLMLVTSAGILWSMPDPHDSLLYGGDDEIPIIFSKHADEVCSLKVVGIEGEAWGTVLVDTVMEGMGCGEGKFRGKVEVEKKVKINDLLAAGHKIGVDGRGFLTLQLYDGANIAINGNSIISFPANYCRPGDEDVHEIFVHQGTVLIGHKGSSKPFMITAVRSQTINRHTQYTVSVINDIDTTDIIKVYEGSVEVNLISPDASNIDENSAKIEQLTKDFQEGKISMEELQNQVMEYQTEMQNQISEMQPVTVEAGYKCTATKNSLKVEPIEENDVRWWEEMDVK